MTSFVARMREHARLQEEYVQNILQKYDRLYVLADQLAITPKQRKELAEIDAIDPDPSTNSVLQFTEFPDLKQLKKVIDSQALNEEKQEELRSYYSLARANGGQVHVSYKQRLYNGSPYGRFYPSVKGSCTTQSGSVRAAVYSGKEMDIDIQNCAFNVLKHICQTNGIPVTVIAEYIDNREAFLGDLAITETDFQNYVKSSGKTWNKRKLAKKVVTALLFAKRHDTLGYAYGVKSYSILGPSLTRLAKEAKRIRRNIIQLEQFSTLVQDIKTHAGVDYHEGKALSFIINEFEKKYVVSAMQTFRDHEIEVRSYAFDGFHVASTDKDLVDVVLEKINKDLPVDFIVKPWDKSILETTSQQKKKVREKKKETSTAPTTQAKQVVAKGRKAPMTKTSEVPFKYRRDRERAAGKQDLMFQQVATLTIENDIVKKALLKSQHMFEPESCLVSSVESEPEPEHVPESKRKPEPEHEPEVNDHVVPREPSVPKQRKKTNHAPFKKKGAIPVPAGFFSSSSSVSKKVEKAETAEKSEKAVPVPVITGVGDEPPLSVAFC